MTYVSYREEARRDRAARAQLDMDHDRARADLRMAEKRADAEFRREQQQARTEAKAQRRAARSSPSQLLSYPCLDSIVSEKGYWYKLILIRVMRRV